MYLCRQFDLIKFLEWRPSLQNLWMEYDFSIYDIKLKGVFCMLVILYFDSMTQADDLLYIYG